MSDRFGMSDAEFNAWLVKRTLAKQELHTMQLAAISTATIQNTRKTIADRIGRDNPYCTQAYLDVCAAIDREIRQRESKLVREMEAEAYLLDRNNLAAQLEVARVALGRISRQLDACPFVTAEEALAALPTAAQNLSATKTDSPLNR